MSEGIKGYKVFGPDWRCKGFQYEVGKTFEEDVKPSCCNRGFHFCLKIEDCYAYYSFSPDNKVAEVIALGEVDYARKDSKCCTNRIQIVREIPWDELTRIVNTGNQNTGIGNIGHQNTGNRNTGSQNVGNRNTGGQNVGNQNTGDSNVGKQNTGNRNVGNWNTGNRNMGSLNTGNRNMGGLNTGDRNMGSLNTGDRNMGSLNTGDRNMGNQNTGDRNRGNRNTGDWNCSSFNTGCFNTTEQNITMFNKPSNWTYEKWLSSEARTLLDQIPPIRQVLWVDSSDMPDEEKKAHPTYKTTGGYLEKIERSSQPQIWWDMLPECQREIIYALPNFDADIFELCTGINVKKSPDQ